MGTDIVGQRIDEVYKKTLESKDGSKLMVYSLNELKDLANRSNVRISTKKNVEKGKVIEHLLNPSLYPN